jgi:MFS family permease
MSTIMAANLIDRAGRRTLLLIGTSIMMISLLVLSLVLSFANNDQFTQGVIAIMAVLTFVVGYAIGLGAVSWVVMAEIMPTRLRTKAYGFFASISYGCNLIIGLFTLTAIHLLGNNSADLDDDESSKANKNGVAYLYFIFAGY